MMKVAVTDRPAEGMYRFMFVAHVFFSTNNSFGWANRVYDIDTPQPTSAHVGGAQANIAKANGGPEIAMVCITGFYPMS